MSVVLCSNLRVRRVLGACVALVVIISLFLGAPEFAVEAGQDNTGRPWWYNFVRVGNGIISALKAARTILEDKIHEKTGEAWAATLLKEFKEEVVNFGQRVNEILECSKALRDLSPDDVRKLENEAKNVGAEVTKLNRLIVLGSVRKIEKGIQDVNRKLVRLEVALWDVVANAIDKNRGEIQESRRELRRLENAVSAWQDQSALLIGELQKLAEETRSASEILREKNEEQAKEIEDLRGAVIGLKKMVEERPGIIAERQRQLEELQKEVRILRKTVAQELARMRKKHEQLAEDARRISALEERIKKFEGKNEEQAKEIEDLRGAVIGLKKMVEERPGIIAERQRQLEELQKEVRILRKTVAQELARMRKKHEQLAEDAEKRIKSLEGIYRNLASRIDRLESTKTQQDRAIEQLRQEISSVKATVARQEREIATSRWIMLLLAIGVVVAVAK